MKEGRLATSMRVDRVRPKLIHTAWLDAATRTAARTLLWEVFGSEMTEDDWEHCLGGIHALVWEGSELTGHGAVVQRQLRHGGRGLRAGFVEGLAVQSDRRGRGYGAVLMTALEDVIRNAYDVGALSATEQAAEFYAARGWTLWLGPSSAFTPTGIERTPDEDGGIYVLPVSATVDIHGELTCDWRDGDLW
jgi:aminoglycoside 2'-N-acetyltransferase I